MDLKDTLGIDYREPFICPFHSCLADKGWCWECAVESYGYEDAKLIYESLAETSKVSKVD